MGFMTAQVGGLLGAGLAAGALSLGLPVTAHAAPRTLPVARMLRVTRLWQAGDEGQGVRVGVISGGVRNFRVLVRRRHPAVDHRAFRSGRRPGRRGRLDAAGRP